MKTTRRKWWGAWVAATLFAYLDYTPNLAKAEGGSLPPRKSVIPKEVIEAFSMEPATTRMFSVLGEDGNWYGIDDTLRVLFEMTKKHWYDDMQERQHNMMQQAPQMRKR